MAKRLLVETVLEKMLRVYFPLSFSSFPKMPEEALLKRVLLLVKMPDLEVVGGFALKMMVPRLLSATLPTRKGLGTLNMNRLFEYLDRTISRS